MTCGCSPIAGGLPVGDGVAAVTVGSPINIDVLTVDATAQTINIGTLAAVGAGLTFVVVIEGTQSNGQRGLYLERHGNAARNAIGSNLVTPVAIGSTGYTDAALPPWSTIGVPAGWAAQVALAGNVLQLQWNGAAGQNVRWRGIIMRWGHNGATL